MRKAEIMNNDPIETLTKKGFEIEFQSHAKSILYGEFFDPLTELCRILSDLKLPITEIIGSGGGETKFTQRLRRSLHQKGWPKHNFTIEKVVDGTPRESTSHEVDHVKKIQNTGVLACEIEWNNKDPFFDRDLENFKRLHAEGAISIGIIITRGSSLQKYLTEAVYKFAEDRQINNYDDLAKHGYTPTAKQKKEVEKQVQRKLNPMPFKEAWTKNFIGNKYGQATTHWGKLKDRIDRGVGNPCPLLCIGLPSSIVIFDNEEVELLDADT
ncbi:TPA: restriction endonuclease [Pseudomonas aeruginosa]|uniref:BglII/BstYI family type II restriction endonuclease n=1 Tax=Pseudomonas aeruginosa TaxID=287 RepID=UPI000B235A2A|nr:BglII/BstYI family type II restriction endonuclease [Pseudomonas aeruginosa]MCT1273514.1 restriction endonuclease [Pseudomonas aeruginosa]VTQ97731.1 Restriction endonuclease BglII [Pseudomonas aeruginosa]HBO2548827.1 restriction endonuclease [Pseudomonas aeruginosa]HCE5732654.1 restriction endonuclease [Pseudomonas aeruginosa]HCG0877113.1 restriction endonuclease [Pseudomonas aeruginosa]